MKRMLIGMAIGAGAMYLLDPESGQERRNRLFGFYSDNKDTFQDYAQTASQTAVTVGQTVGSAAGTVAEKATEVGAKAEKAVKAKAGAETNGSTNVDSLLENRTAGRKAAGDDAPGMGGSLST
jgi:gas vesicle protein